MSIARDEKDLRREIASMRSSSVNSRKLAPVAEAMESALNDVLAKPIDENDAAEINRSMYDPIGESKVANPASPDQAKRDAGLEVHLSGDPEQREPGTALVNEGQANELPQAEAREASEAAHQERVQHIDVSDEVVSAEEAKDEAPAKDREDRKA